MSRNEKNPWSLLKLDGNHPGAVRAEIFRAFLLKEFGAGARDMVDAGIAFARETGMSFSTFFGGLKVKDIGKKEWGRQHCVWEYRGQKKMLVTALSKRGDGPIGDVDEACQKELEDAAGSQVPEDIDFERIAADHGVTRETVLAAYAKALGRALRARQPAGEEPKRKRKGGGGRLLFPSVLLWAIRAFWDGLSGQKRKRARYQQIWIEKLLDNPALDARITLVDGKVVTGRLRDVDEDFFTLETGSGTEVVDRAGIQAIQGVENAKGQTGAGGVGTIRVWFADRGFGFIESDGQTFFFRRDGIGVKGLAEHLDAAGPDKRAIRQLVHFSVEAAAGGGRSYPRVRIDRWLVDQSQPGEVARTGADEYQLGKASLKNGDIASAKEHFRLALEKGAGKQQVRALKEWAWLLNRADPNAAYDLLEKHRPRIQDKNELVSLDRMEVTCLLRAKRANEALPLIHGLLGLPGISGGQREYYENLRQRIQDGTLWGQQGDFVGKDESMGVAWEAYADVLTRHCDYHGLEEKGITGEECLPDSDNDTDNDNGDALENLRTIIESRINYQLGTVPKSEKVFYHGADFSTEMARLNLAALCVAQERGDAKSAQYWLRDYSWRKALCCMFAEEGYRPEEVLAHLIWRARPGPVTSGYFAETLPLLVCGVLQWSSREELRRIVEDGNHRKELLRRFPVDPVMKESLQRWVGQHDVALLMPKITEIFERANLVEESPAAGMAEGRRRIHQIRKRWGDKLSQLDFEAVTGAIQAMVASPEEQESAAATVVFLKKAEEYAGALEYERRRGIAEELRAMGEAHEKRHVWEGTTLFATDIGQPTVDATLACVERDFAGKGAQGPELSLENASTSQYRLRDGVVELQVLLQSNDPSRPSISEISVQVLGDNAPNDDSGTAYLSELEGGGRREVRVAVIPSEVEVANKHGIARIQTDYVTATGMKETKTFSVDFSVAAGEYEFIPNPYIRFENGTATGEYFVGRDAMIKEIIDVFKTSDGGQCYVLYGQRRSGKSSVLENVQEELRGEGFLITRINMPDLDDKDLKGASITEYIAGRLERDFLVARPEARRKRKRNEEIAPEDQLKYLGQFAKSLPGRRNWIICIDEFTYLYNYLRKDRKKHRGLVQGFLRFLKGMLEERVCHLLLIGQESIVLLQKEFPNEFAVFRLNRLSYLDKEAVRHLADDPIKKGRDGAKESRYQGKAFQRLFEATAGQPWFTQRFCSRMVNYMNEKKIPDISEEVITQVEHLFCKGDEDGRVLKVPAGDFEPFVNLAAPEVDEEEVVRGYYRIAERTASRDAWIPMGDVGLPASVVRLLDDRGIVIVRDGKVRLRMGLFSSWLRANPGETRESFGRYEA